MSAWSCSRIEYRMFVYRANWRVKNRAGVSKWSMDERLWFVYLLNMICSYFFSFNDKPKCQINSLCLMRICSSQLVPTDHSRSPTFIHSLKRLPSQLFNLPKSRPRIIDSPNHSSPPLILLEQKRRKAETRINLGSWPMAEIELEAIWRKRNRHSSKLSLIRLWYRVRVSNEVLDKRLGRRCRLDD